jgi:hypothetical protein
MLGKSLSEKLENEGAVFEFIVLGKDEQNKECLFVYIRPADSKKLRRAPQEWCGLSVKYLQLGKELKELVH